MWQPKSISILWRLDYLHQNMTNYHDVVYLFGCSFLLQSLWCHQSYKYGNNWFTTSSRNSLKCLWSFSLLAITVSLNTKWNSFRDAIKLMESLLVLLTYNQMHGMGKGLNCLRNASQINKSSETNRLDCKTVCQVLGLFLVCMFSMQIGTY